MSSNDKFWLIPWISLFVCVTVSVVGTTAPYGPGPDDPVMSLKEGGSWSYRPQRSGDDEGYCKARVQESFTSSGRVPS